MCVERPWSVETRRHIRRQPVNSYTNIRNVGSEHVNLNIHSVGVKSLINNSLTRKKSFGWSDLIEAFSQVQLLALS